MRKFNITVNGASYEVEVEETTDGLSNMPAAPIQIAAPAAAVAPKPVVAPAPKPVAAPKAPVAASAGTHKIASPMPGTIVKVNVTVGQKVEKGTILCILEAMKMENEIMAPDAGTVASVNTQQGATVNTGDLLLTLN